VSPAYGWSGTRATINYNSPAAEKNSGEARKQAGKKEGGLGEGIFARLLSAEGGMGWESVSAIPASAGRQNRNIFVSLIEKNFGGARIKKCKENFSVLLAAVAKRRRTETLGGIQSAKSSGFCSKWVRISSNKHHFFIKKWRIRDFFSLVATRSSSEAGQSRCRSPMVHFSSTGCARLGFKS